MVFYVYGGIGFVLRKFQQARTARVCMMALVLHDLESHFLHLFQVSSDSPANNCESENAKLHDATFDFALFCLP